MIAVAITHAHTYPAWKHLLIVDVALDPSHQMLNILRSWHLGWTLELLLVLPQVLESALLLVFVSTQKRSHHSLIGRLHLWTRLWRAEFRDRAIEQVDLIVEIDDWSSNVRQTF